jgi:hypothetical protein
MVLRDDANRRPAFDLGDHGGSRSWEVLVDGVCLEVAISKDGLGL